MKQSLLFAAGVSAVLAFGGQSLIGGAQPSAPASGGGPFDNLHWRPIGPASMSGRISDIAVYEANSNIWYIGSAHGGVWKTVNHGTTWEPQFQDQGLMSIGDIAVSQSDPDLVYVGSGESNNRQSTSWGDGVYKSTDGGKTYTNTGLKTSRHINRIVIDPRDNDTVWVAATGPLFGPGGERGIFKTTDGGRTWKQTLKVDEDTGANDLVIDPSSNKTLYASTYQRRRTSCCMNGGGPGSGIWKSTDAGETWTRLKTGLPEGSLGRIGLDVYRKRPNILYAAIEGPAPAGRGGAGGGGAAGGAGRGGAGAAGGAATPASEEAPGQAAGGGGGGGRGVVTGVNATATGLYRSDDAGATWRKVNNVNPRPMYFSQVRVDPNDPEVIYMGGVDLQMSTDGGKSVNTAAASAIHSDHHAIWIDPANSNHVIIGNDGGLAQTWDQAKTWIFVPNLPVGLFYHVSVDMATPFNVCGGMQDNYDWCGPSQVRGAAGIANHEWQTIQGGDGFVVLQDPKDSRVIYSESQDGNVVRVDRMTNESISIRPQAAQGDPPYRWHWDTPMLISAHDAAVVYVAGNRVFRAPDRGLTFTPISPDLTTGEDSDREAIVTMGLKGSDIAIAKNDGIVSFGTIVALAESPKTAGVLYAGTDDGRLQVTKDAGKSWTDVYAKLPDRPKGAFVSRIAPSRFEAGTVYATIDDHRQNNYETYIYASRDYGQTWTSLNGNLKGEVIKTITEDTRNPDVLYAGAETGLFVSTDRGASWTRPKWNLPTVRVDEIVIHPRDNAMVLATHGRALWILDHIEPIQEYAAARNSDAKLFTPAPASMFRRPTRDRNYEFWGNQVFFGENPPPAAQISYFVKNSPSDVKLRITDAAGREVREIAVPSSAVKPGINTACWDLRVQPIPAPDLGTGAGRGGRGAGGTNPPPAEPFGFGCGAPAGAGGGGGGGFGGGGGPNPGPLVVAGTYTVALVVDGKSADTRPIRVAADPEVLLTDAQRKQLFDMGMELHEVQKRATEAAAGVASLNRQITQLSQTIADRTDIPAEVKTSFDQLKADVTAMVTKLPIGGGGGRGGGGGGGRGADPSLMGKLAQAKNGVGGGMWPTSITMKAY
ncbi:MAG TPA: hypothetical protein VNC21_13390, partial [Vicinamibacterales bacterium]|nr:hypothetical protein [Vicinamibacterales bacterium]